jgi:hypothetical protein
VAQAIEHLPGQQEALPEFKSQYHSEKEKKKKKLVYFVCSWGHPIL